MREPALQLLHLVAVTPVPGEPEEAVQVTEHQPNGDIATLISALHSAYPGIYFSQQDKDQITSVQSLTFRLFWA